FPGLLLWKFPVWLLGEFPVLLLGRFPGLLGEFLGFLGGEFPVLRKFCGLFWGESPLISFWGKFFILYRFCGESPRLIIGIPILGNFPIMTASPTMWQAPPTVETINYISMCIIIVKEIFWQLLVYYKCERDLLAIVGIYVVAARCIINVKEIFWRLLVYYKRERDLLAIVYYKRERDLLAIVGICCCC
ncbi:hypothetical protein IE077_001067, partial [Cardiosporidium cionae]